jgi:hypothetical protein
MSELPFSRVYGYRLIEAGVLSSVLLKTPGSQKGIRLVDSDSLDSYLENLTEQQKREAHNERVFRPNAHR